MTYDDNDNGSGNLMKIVTIKGGIVGSHVGVNEDLFLR